jgi:hypothetical protein
MLSYSIVIFHLSFNFLCLLLLYSIYLCGSTAQWFFAELHGWVRIIVKICTEKGKIVAYIFKKEKNFRDFFGAEPETKNSVSHPKLNMNNAHFLRNWILFRHI